MNRKEKLLGALFVAAVVAWSSMGCKMPQPGTVGRKLIDCGTEAVKKNAIGIIPEVNSCLTGDSAKDCLLGLVNPAVGITYDVVACVVRRQGAEFAASEQINPLDVRSKVAAGNAHEFIAAEQIEFTDGP